MHASCQTLLDFTMFVFLSSHALNIECADNSFTFGKMNYFESQMEEHLACRQNVALFDLTAFAKLEVKVRNVHTLQRTRVDCSLEVLHTVCIHMVQGKDAVDALQTICSNNVSIPVGHVTYTGILNHQGGFKTDCTVTRLDEERYNVSYSYIIL